MCQDSQLKPAHCFSVTFSVSRKCSILTAPRKVLQWILRLCSWLVSVLCVCQPGCSWQRLSQFLQVPHLFLPDLLFSLGLFWQGTFQSWVCSETPLRCFCSCPLPSLHPRICWCWNNKCASCETLRMSTKPPLWGGAVFNPLCWAGGAALINSLCLGAPKGWLLGWQGCLGPEIVVISPHLHGLNGHQQKGPAAAGAARTAIIHSGQEIANIALGPEHWERISGAAALSGNTDSPDVHLFLEFYFFFLEEWMQRQEKVLTMSVFGFSIFVSAWLSYWSNFSLGSKHGQDLFI